MKLCILIKQGLLILVRKIYYKRAPLIGERAPSGVRALDLQALSDSIRFSFFLSFFLHHILFLESYNLYICITYSR